ncbi:hypothetical protein HNY73_014611 [Argiope bruennichi]|uniref:Uncharacterized protein n=1 Tax=Argiope bruennichi TaxID=94029 RepID=A0A8T0EUV8_ARGBR|nr:hypothetical protein HNY73_014611 [Argiope bruennichi]
MSLSTKEKVFMVQHYFRSYRRGREGGLSLKKIAEQSQEKFNKAAPSNTVMLSNVTKFRSSVSVWCQRKGNFHCEDPPKIVPALSEKMISFRRNLYHPLFQNVFESLRERYEQCLQ